MKLRERKELRQAITELETIPIDMANVLLERALKCEYVGCDAGFKKKHISTIYFQCLDYGHIVKMMNVLDVLLKNTR